MITRNQAIEMFKTQSGLAKALGLTRSAVHEWKNSDKPIPAEHVGRFCKATKLKPREVRPDLWPYPSVE
jgi:DNA-binding transcriptional regulator YdaS (Cro superfamily)